MRESHIATRKVAAAAHVSVCRNTSVSAAPDEKPCPCSFSYTVGYKEQPTTHPPKASWRPAVGGPPLPPLPRDGEGGCEGELQIYEGKKKGGRQNGRARMKGGAGGGMGRENQGKWRAGAVPFYVKGPPKWSGRGTFATGTMEL